MTSQDWWGVTPLVLAALVPSTFLVGALLVSSTAPLRFASAVTFPAAGLALLAVALRAGAPESSDGAASLVHPWVQLELATGAMLTLVCGLAVVVARYARTSLAGEAELERHARALLGALASVSTLVISNHLAVLVAAWFATSLFVHQLLTFYRKRPQALVAAHKKFLLSRLADVSLVASLGLLWAEVGSLRVDAVNAFAQANAGASLSLHLAAALLVFGVLLKSAQLPFHGWMTQVMEAPTPVSALLHAGVVNIGGFVLIRLAPLMNHAAPARGLLLAVGLTTALVATLVMTTRVSIKLALAWSTIAQMGFLLVQCALGAWHLALLHLLAHSVFKAHAFLSAGSVVRAWRGASLVEPLRPSLGLTAVSAAGALGVVALLLMAASSQGAVQPSHRALAVVLGLSLVPTLSRGLAAGWRPAARAGVFVFGATAAYLTWHALFEGVAAALHVELAAQVGWAVVGASLVALFLVQTVLQTRPTGALASWLKPRLFAGLYLDEWFTRMTFRLWPPRIEAPVPPTSHRGVGAAQEARSW